jgi:hypothetical protein
MLKEGSGSAIEAGVDEMTQIKILQILLIFLNPKTIRLSKELVDQVILFKLTDSDLVLYFQPILIEIKRSKINDSGDTKITVLLNLYTFYSEMQRYLQRVVIRRSNRAL